MRKVLILLFCLLPLLSGCVSTGFHYLEPDPRADYQNKVEVDKSQDDVWKELISGLSSSFFIINNMEKESGFINVSFSGDPEEYIDGGMLSVSVKNLAGDRKYVFPAAQKWAQYECMVGRELSVMTRGLSLDGRANIIVSEISKNKTLVQVNPRFVLTLRNSGRSYMGTPVLNEQTIFVGGSSDGRSDGGTIFRSNGKFEKLILDFVK